MLSVINLINPTQHDYTKRNQYTILSKSNQLLRQWLARCAWVCELDPVAIARGSDKKRSLFAPDADTFRTLSTPQLTEMTMGCEGNYEWRYHGRRRAGKYDRRRVFYGCRRGAFRLSQGDLRLSQEVFRTVAEPVRVAGS